MNPSDQRFELRSIRSNDSFRGLSLGSAEFAPLKLFLQRHAKRYDAQNLARTYGMFPSEGPPRAVGYVTLVCGEVVAQDDRPLVEPEVEYRYPSYPAVKIARLAVDRRYQGRGLGRQLVEFSLGLMKDLICPTVGCRFAVVDSKQASVDFYERCGFTMLDTEDNRERSQPVMFIDLHKIEV